MSKILFKIDNSQKFEYALNAIGTQAICVGTREDIEALYQNMWETTVVDCNDELNFSGCNMYKGIYNYVKQDGVPSSLKMKTLEQQLIKDMYQRLIDTVRYRMDKIALAGCSSLVDYNRKYPEDVMSDYCVIHCGFEFIECLDFKEQILVAIDYCLSVGRRVGVHIVLLGTDDICDILKDKLYRFSDKFVFSNSRQEILKLLVGLNKPIEKDGLLVQTANDIDLKMFRVV